ncbi:MAG: DNA mismatch repair endonuclease MutL [Oscillospiraceae bacterium]
MGRINLLQKETSELIAAGEVIERPSSVIKELIENSIDSGADNITVEIKNGGISYIRITDNGCGMEPEDVPLAFLRHATSKISSKEDLNSINTLGFRGEALASICAVARVEVLTKVSGSMYGTHYIIEGSEEKLNEQTGCPDGTTIIIRDIFFNVPARLKFLKKDVAEGNAIADITSKIAVSHPEIAFKFIRNNHQDFFTPGDGDLYSSIYSVMGKDFAGSLIPVKYKLNGVKIQGFTVKPLKCRPKRNFQYFFVNGRYVKSYICSYALEEAYQNSIMEGKFPACVLLMEVSPVMLDVNVHPAKIEVRFNDDRLIHDSIFFSVKTAIQNNSEPMPIEIKQPVPDYTKPLPESYNIGRQLMFDTEKQAEQPEPRARINEVDEVVGRRENIPTVGTASVNINGSGDFQGNAFGNGFYGNSRYDPNQNIEIKRKIENIQPNKNVSVQVEYNDSHNESFQTDIPYTVEPPDDIPANVKPEIPEHSGEYKYITEQSAAPIIEQPKKEIFFRIIGEAFKEYIVAEVDKEIIIVDKHAAHERILFEKLKSGQQNLQCQMMLEAVDVMLSNDEFDALIQNKQTAFDLGFSFKENRNTSVSVNGIPAMLDGCDPADLVIELADNFRNNRSNPLPVILDDMYHTFACKAAIKANDENSPIELSEIVRTLLENESIRYCPHGRPVMFKITKYELDKQFRRIV